MVTPSKETTVKAKASEVERSAIAAARQSAREAKAAARREAILAAALDEFSAGGFAATRLDDVAARAGVAKGTIYLYFADKEALFQELVRFQLYPMLDTFEMALKSDLPLRVLIDQAVEVMARQVFGTRRRLVIQLIISEGPRFPALAEFYYREVISRMLGAVRARLVRAIERGEICDDTLVRFPQLLNAATITAVVWQSLFDPFDPLDAPAMLRAYFDRLFPRDGRPS
jgi:AcrR family transcriptional regulator